MRAAQRAQRETMTDDKTTEPSSTEPSSTEPSSTEPSSTSAEDIDSRFSRITFPIEHDHGLSPE